MNNTIKDQFLNDHVTEIRADWMERYGNQPYLYLEGIDIMPFRDSQWRDLGSPTAHPQSKIFFTEDSNGFTRYLAHTGDDSNNGGFGGAEFLLPMQDGTIKKLRGPWSSRCSAVNMLLPKKDWITEIRWKNHSGSIKVSKLLELAEKLQPNFFLVREKIVYGCEIGSVHPSVRPDCIQKPGGMITSSKGAEIEVLYDPPP